MTIIEKYRYVSKTMLATSLASVIFNIILLFTLGFNEFSITFIHTNIVFTVLALYSHYVSWYKGKLKTLVRNARMIAFSSSQITIILLSVYGTTTFYPNSDIVVTHILEVVSTIMLLISVANFSIYKLLRISLDSKRRIVNETK